jgi:hypothetical protein
VDVYIYLRTGAHECRSASSKFGYNRQAEDKGVKAVIYKSGKRKAIEDLGYVIVGNIGDQWSDLSGTSIGSRVFKLPNPMYYIS